MSQQIQDKINQLRAEIANLEHQKQIGVSLQVQEQLDREIEGKQTEIAELEQQIKAAEQAEREQKVQEVNSDNSDIALGIIGSVFPDRKAIEAKLGITEFEIIRTDLLQLIDLALTDRTETTQKKNDEELATKDEKIRLLSSQGLELQRQLDEANRKINEMDDMLKNQHTEIADLNAENDELNEANKVVGTERDALKKALQLEEDKTKELQTKLDEALKPKAESAPGQSFTDRMNEIKSKNEARIKSSAELALENGLGFRGKVDLPSLPAQESPFRSENTATEPSNNQLPSAETATPVGNSFQTFEPVVPSVEGVGKGIVAAVQGESSTGELAQEAGSEGEEPVTPSQLEARLAKFREDILAEITGESAA